jgi:predicted RNA-binding protein with RPS1 domain
MKESNEEIMSLNNAEHRYESALPSIDEGWWESVLAEEERQYSRSAKPRPAPLPKIGFQSNEDQSPEAELIPGNPIMYPRADDGMAKLDKRVVILQSLQIGAHLKGTVTSITDFGAFVDLGGLEGLIHISELSWGRVAHPRQIVRLGEAVEVQVLEISRERNRVALSLKRMVPNPWEHAEAEFAIDTIQPAVVSSILSYGAFARLKPGIEGLIHASKMPLGAGQTPRDILKEGQDIQVRVLYIDSSHQRMGLKLQTVADA